MVSYREFVNAFRDLRLSPAQPVIVHASLTSIGEIRGGAETLIGALLSSSRGIMAPAFTYKTMLTPEAGPEDNAIQYGLGKDTNRMAEFFTPEMPADLWLRVAERYITLYERLTGQEFVPGAYPVGERLVGNLGIQVDK